MRWPRLRATMLGYDARQMQRRLQIDVDHRIDLGRIDLLERRAGREDTGIVDQHIDLDVLKRLRNARGVAHIRLHGDGAGLLLKLGKLRFVAADGIDGEAASAQHRHDGLADAAGGAGDDGDAIGVRHRCSPR